MSINLELPTAEGLSRLAPNKHRKTILTPMRQIQNGISVSKQEVAFYRPRPGIRSGWTVYADDYRRDTGA